MTNDPFAPLGDDARSSSPPPPARAWTCVQPVPADAPPAPTSHPDLGAPTMTWAYHDCQGRILGYALRFDRPAVAEGGADEPTRDHKEFRTLTLWRPEHGKSVRWQWKSWPVPRPLYGLDRLAERPKAPVVVCEGEKAADAAARLLPGFAVVTSPNGSKSAGKADWSPLAGRRVILWPDADDAGAAYADAVASMARDARASSVAVLTPPKGVVEGWDAADASADGWTTAEAEAFVASARSAAVVDLEAARRAKSTFDGGAKKAVATTDEDTGEGRRRRPAQRDQLMGLCSSLELWRDKMDECYATLPFRSHHENWRLKSEMFRRWLSVRAYEETGLAPGIQALEDTIRVLAAKAHSEGRKWATRRRVGTIDGRAYLDLCDDEWRAVEIDDDGWRVIDRAPVAFVRTNQMQPLPEPEAGYGLEELRRFVNTDQEEDFVLLVAWILAALHARGPYPILVLNGEQGTGKSMLSRLVRSLVDPSVALVRSSPKDDRDLVVAAVNSHVIALDNLSSVPVWLSEALCRLATGGGYASRQLQTDSDEIVMEACNPIILNGIPSLTERPDLAQRAITVTLRPIPETERRTEQEILEDWEKVAPRVLGALLDGLSTALRRLPTTRLDRMPRMADFARFITAAEPGLGFEPGSFMTAYGQNQADTTETTFEADPVAIAIRDFIQAEHPSGWHGSATELLAALNIRTPDHIKRLRLWCSTPHSLGDRVRRIAPVLRAQGFAVDRKHSRVRVISIVPQAAS